MNIDEAFDYTTNYEAKVREASDFLKLHMRKKPDFGIVLGSGLGSLASESKWSNRIPYYSIPNFPKSTVQGHEGIFYFSEVENVPVAFLQGRKHYYEVADEPMNSGILQVVFPVHVLACLGIENLIITNAAGGLNPDYQVGDLMAISSHINFITNPLLGRHLNFAKVNSSERVERFLPMNDSYHKELKKIFTGLNDKIHEGIYLGLTGPSYETEAECLAFRQLGADAIGMSTTPEVIAARSRGMNVLGISCITNKINPDGKNVTTHDDVKKILQSKETKELFFESMNGFFREWKRGFSF